MKEQLNNLTLAAYNQEKQAILHHRIAERNQLFMVILAVLMASFYFIHLYTPDFDPVLFISLVMLLSLAGTFSIWVSHRSSMRACRFVDEFESKLDLPDHLRKDSWLWNYVLRAQWGLISKFVLILLTAVLCISIAGLSDRRIETQRSLIAQFEAFQKIEDPVKRGNLLEGYERAYKRDEAKAFLIRMAGLLIILFLLVTSFVVGRKIGYSAGKHEFHPEAHHDHHHHGVVPVPDIQKEFEDKYQSIYDMRDRVTNLENRMKKVFPS